MHPILTIQIRLVIWGVIPHIDMAMPNIIIWGVPHIIMIMCTKDPILTIGLKIYPILTEPHINVNMGENPHIHLFPPYITSNMGSPSHTKGTTLRGNKPKKSPHIEK